MDAQKILEQKKITFYLNEFKENVKKIYSDKEKLNGADRKKYMIS